MIVTEYSSETNSVLSGRNGFTLMTIPYSKPYITQDEIDATVAVLKRGDIAVGPEIEEFEKSVANYIGKKYGIAVTNGTAAVHLALLAIGIDKDDEVILPASVCPVSCTP